MANQSWKCCDQNRLEKFLNEQLDERDESIVMDHINGCKQCQKSLENIAANRGTWDDLKSHLARHFSVAAGGETISIVERDRDLEMERLQEYLGPTDNPDMLGRLGSYEVCGLVGRGSTGVVVKALEPRLNRYVAIKVLSPSFSSNGPARTRFEREARSVAAVSHEHVVPIYAVDEYRGLPFIVMQYIPGGSLLQRIESRGPLDTIEVVRLGMQVAKGLAAAHEQGIVHRDVKPANVMLETKVDRAMVSDFGLARVADEAAMTRSGVIAGTPQYMSPEQAKGEAIDQRSDLFSLGSVMYHAATGRAPFRAETVFGVIQRVCTNEPRSIREINPRIEPWLEGFIQKLHAKDRADRFATAEDVAELLSRELAYLQGPTVSPIPQRPWFVRPKKKKTARSGGAKSWLSAAVVLAALASVAALIWQNSLPQEEGSTATANAQAVVPDHRHQDVRVTGDNQFADDGRLTKKTVRKSFAILDSDALTADVDVGSLVVVGDDVDEVQLEITRFIASDDEAIIARVIGHHDVQLEKEGVDLQLTASFDDEDDLGDYFRGAKFKLLVPKDHNINLETDAGSITVHDLSGKLEAMTDGGAVVLKNVSGLADIETLGGPIALVNCTAIDAETGGGSIMALFREQPTSACRLKTGNGPIKVGISPDVNLDVLTESGAGTIETLYDEQGSNFVVGDGGPQLAVLTGAGAVSYYFATQDEIVVDNDFGDDFLMDEIDMAMDSLQDEMETWSDKVEWLGDEMDTLVDEMESLGEEIESLQEDESDEGHADCNDECDEECDESDEDCDECGDDCEERCDQKCCDGAEDKSDACQSSCSRKSKEEDEEYTPSASDLDVDDVTESNDFVRQEAQELEESDEATQELKWETDISRLESFEMQGETLSNAVKGGGKLVIKADLGAVIVKTNDEEKFTFDWTATIFAADQDEADQLFAEAKVSMATEEFELDPETDAGVRVEFDEEFLKNRGFNRFRNFKLIVSVPEEYDIDVTTQAGSISLADIVGTVDLRTKGGALMIGNVTGTVNAETSGGSISLESASEVTGLKTAGGFIRVGDIVAETSAVTSGGSIETGRINAATHLRTSGGSIAVGVIAAPTTVNTSGGSISASIASGIDGEVQLKTSAGGITIGLARGAGFDVTASTSVGHVVAPFMEKPKSSVTHELNGGGTVVTARTSAGGIKFDYFDDIP